MLMGLPDGPYPGLKVLSAAGNKITDVPQFLLVPQHMRDVTLIDGDDVEREKNVDEEIIRPEDLRSVNLRSNLLKGTIVLGNYGNLTQLDVSENSIEYLDLTALSKLQNVQCSKNRLQELALNGSSLLSLIAGNNNLKKLTVTPTPLQLKHLDVSYNWLEHLPDWVDGCSNLRTIFASHNHLTGLPDRLFSGGLVALQTLQLSFNRLTNLPPVSGHLALRELFLQSNQINSLPQHFFLATSRMRVLNMSKNRLKSLPSAVGDGHQLERLYLTCNFLADVTALTRFMCLRILHIAYNDISQLPEHCVSCWPELEELVVSGNRLNIVPSAVAKWSHLRILRLHSNLLTSCPSLATSTSLKVLDLSHNQLDKVNLSSLVPKQLQSLDLSGNTRLHVDPSHFREYKSQRKVSLVDTSGQNRDCLPILPASNDPQEDKSAPWTLGFAETAGNRDRLCVSQLRMTAFAEDEALFGIFDGGNDEDLPKHLVNITPRLVTQERAVKETASEYIKYTLLAAHRELKDKGHRVGVCAMLCHLVRDNAPGPPRSLLRIASVGEAKSVLRRAEGTVTLAHVPTQPTRSQLGNISMFPMVVPDPHVTELSLRDSDEFLIMANKRLWEVISPEEAAAEVRGLDPKWGAKRLQDLAQSYGCEDNLSILVVRLNRSRHARLITELNYTLHKVQDPLCWCDERGPPGDERSSPSGQSDIASSVRTSSTRHYTDDKNELLMNGTEVHNLQSVLMRENGVRKMSSKINHLDEHHLADCEESPSESCRSCSQISEEQLRCWEYMLERNTQLLFDKELDTLSRGFTRRSVPARARLWGRSRSSPHLPDVGQPFLSQQFGSARSYHGCLEAMSPGSRRPLNAGPNAAYFGSLQRLMPYTTDYDFTAMRERTEGKDSLTEPDRMQRYWDVATTEL